MRDRDKIEKNGLTLTSIKSHVQPLSEVTDIESALRDFFTEDGFVVAYLTNRILIGKYHSQKLQFYEDQKIDPQFLLSLRIFNPNMELLLLHSSGTLKGRLRVDGSGELTYIVDACQLLWGTDAEPLKQGFTRLFEERGVELILPLSSIKVDSQKKRVFIQTRNYINFDPETHLASYCDCRFVQFRY